MTTNCDLEEMKHIVQQKFIELVDSGAVFDSDGYGWKHGKWYFSLNEFAHEFGSRRYSFRLLLGWELVAEYYGVALNDIVRAGIRAMVRSRNAAEQANREAACKALQEALKDTATTLAPDVQTGNTEPYSEPQDYPLSKVRKFWQDWKKARGL